MKRLLGLVLVACVAAGPTTVPSKNGYEESGYLNCFEQDDTLPSCLLVKTICYVNRAARSSDIKLIDGVTLVRNTPMERSGKSFEKSEVEIMNELPKNEDKTIYLMNMLYDSIVSFFKSHSLKLSMPKDLTSRALTEGRAKMKKMVLPLIAAAALKAVTFLPFLLGGLGLLTLKTLVFGKIALLVAGFMLFQRFFNRAQSPIVYDNYPPSWYPAANAWTQPQAGSPQGYSRNFDNTEKVDAHNLAYSAHAPDANKTD